MRGRRLNDMRGWELDPQTKQELRAKGVNKNYGTGGILLTSAMPLDETLLVPDEEVVRKETFVFRQTSSYQEKERRDLLRAH